jgi:fructose/tagatose bisphosphate aldolase
MSSARRLRRRVVGEVNEELYSTPEDALATAEALGLGGRGRYILAATFGNVHGLQAGPDESGALGTGLPMRGSHAR